MHTIFGIKLIFFISQIRPSFPFPLIWHVYLRARKNTSKTVKVQVVKGPARALIRFLPLSLSITVLPHFWVSFSVFVVGCVRRALCHQQPIIYLFHLSTLDFLPESVCHRRGAKNLWFWGKNRWHCPLLRLHFFWGPAKSAEIAFSSHPTTSCTRSFHSFFAYLHYSSSAENNCATNADRSHFLPFPIPFGLREGRRDWMGVKDHSPFSLLFSIFILF